MSDEPRRKDWILIPPQARPAVAAVSIGIVALAIWNKVVVPDQPPFIPLPGAVKVYGAADGPVSQLDLSRAAAGAPDSGGERSNAKSLGLAGAASGAAAARDGRAAGRPLTAGAATEPQLTDRTRLAMTEEERSARNEQMIGQLEDQKRKMGIKVLPKNEDGGGTGGFLGLKEPPAAPALRAPAPKLLDGAKAPASVAGAPDSSPDSGPGRLAPDAALVFADADSVASSWVLLGLPGDPPATDFSKARLLAIKPSATKILSVTAGADAVTVVYRSLLPDEQADPARDRAAELPLAPKPVLIYDASPR